MWISNWQFSQMHWPLQDASTTCDPGEFHPFNLPKPVAIRLPLLKHRVEFYWSNLLEGFVTRQLEDPG